MVFLRKKIHSDINKRYFYGFGSQEVFIVYTAEDRIAERDSNQF